MTIDYFNKCEEGWKESGAPSGLFVTCCQKSGLGPTRKGQDTDDL